MTGRDKRALQFAVGLMVGFGIYDWFSHGSINIVRLIFAAIVGGGLYWLILKMQGRE